MQAHCHELVDGAHAAENGIVVDNHMAGDLGIVAHYTMIPDNAVMRKMTISL
jgi:hypothetical protein